MKVKIQMTNDGMKYHKQICDKIGVPYSLTINHWWIHELTEEQFEQLEKAEKNGLLIRIKI